MTESRPLAGKIAWVTGASRGVGLGVAHELGLAGATVYISGRSRRDGQRTDDLPGTIDDTAELVTTSGGRGIAVACDHTNDDAVADVAEQIHKEQGRLDILVNNVWGGYEAYDHEMFRKPIWEQPIWRWDKMFQAGLRANYITTRACLPMMLESETPLVVFISAGDDGKFLGDVQYDIVKNGSDRLAFAVAERHGPDGIMSLALHPGFTRTERVLQALTTEEQLAVTHSPRFVGRAVVALAVDPDLAERSGGAFKCGTLGLEYGFTDIDGSQPEPFCI